MLKWRETKIAKNGHDQINLKLWSFLLAKINSVSTSLCPFWHRLECGASKWKACQSDFENRLIGKSNQSVLDLLIRLSWHAVCPGIEWVLWLIMILGTNCNVLSCDGIAEALPHPTLIPWVDSGLAYAQCLKSNAGLLLDSTQDTSCFEVDGLQIGQ